MSGADLLHRRALVALERSARAERDGRSADALEQALAARKADPTLTAAAVRAAALLHRAGKARRATAILSDAWEAAPHPDLIAALLALAPMETPLERVKRIEKLVRLNPDAAAGHAALAEAALAARLWGQARTHLDRAVDLRPGPGLFILLARLEREERQDESAAQAWLSRVPTAPAEPAWTCRACGKPTDSWAMQCPSCRAVDSLTWA
jgi:HemY protein